MFPSVSPLPTLKSTSYHSVTSLIRCSLPPILDPTHLESTLCTGTLSITLNAQRELCVLSKAGGTALMPEDIMGVVRVGVERVRSLVRVMEDALERDHAGRVVEVR